MMKRYLYIISAALFGLVSCEKDGERLVARLDGDETASLVSFNDNIVLTKDVADRLVLTLYWDEEGSFTLSNPAASVPDDILYSAIQFSSDNDFGNVYEYPLGAAANSAQLTGKQLNVVIGKLGLEPDVEHTVYLRLMTSLGINTQPRYGDAIGLKMTGYFIDMSHVKLLNKEKTAEICSIPARSEGEYAGIVYISAGWLNFWFEEGDDSVWGTVNDGTTGTPFLLSTDGSAWNNWFPAPQGLYYVTMSAATAQWTAASIGSPSVSIGGEQAAMTYAAGSNSLGCVFTATASDMEVGLQQAANKYDSTTGDSSYSEGTVTFVANANGTFEIGEGALNSGIRTGAAGTYTLLLHFNNMKWELLEGEHEIGGGEVEEPEPEIPVDPDKVYEEFLYCHYAWDSGTYWEEKWAATLWSEDKKGIYYGYLSTPSEWTKPYTNFVFSTSLTCNDASATRYGCDTADNSKLVTPPTSGYTMWPVGLGLSKLTVDMRTLSWTCQTLSVPTVNDVAMTFNTSTLLWEATCEVSGKGLIFKYDERTVSEQAEDGTYAVTLDLKEIKDVKFNFTKK